eukprot:m.55406 g.55406  ORF g.55406 m.55406 type:complete len:241 (-) comp6927_c0_seq3:75-797(-)
MRFTWRRIAAAAVVYAGGVYAGATIYQAYTIKPEAASSSARASVWDKLAPKYDSSIGLSERLAGLDDARRDLLARATGRTLEVAAGTGRNLGLYPAGIDLTLTDRSAAMVEVARAKAAAESAPVLVQCHEADAMALPFEDAAFDTVVDTFGLCSADDPVKMLRELKRVCRGRILLLEHGASSWGWLNWYLDFRATAHAAHWGCFWNRDILALVEEAGLEVESIERRHMGTTYLIVAQSAR